MLVLEDVAIQLKSQILLQVNAVIKPGEIVTLMGPSGVGKSSVLAAIAGLLPETFRLSGKIILNQHNITNMPAHLRHTGLLYQDALLFEHLDVTGNIVFAMPGKKHRDKTDRHGRMLWFDGAGRCCQGRGHDGTQLPFLTDGGDGVFRGEKFTLDDSGRRRLVRRGGTVGDDVVVSGAIAGVVVLVVGRGVGVLELVEVALLGFVSGLA